MATISIETLQQILKGAFDWEARGEPPPDVSLTITFPGPDGTLPEADRVITHVNAFCGAGVSRTSLDNDGRLVSVRIDALKRPGE